MTFSIVAYDRDAAQLGGAVASCSLAIGRAVVWSRAGVGAIATQARTGRALGARGLDLIGAGRSPTQALTELLAADADAAERQVAAVSPDTAPFAWTGGRCIGACGHIVGPTWVAAGNTLVSRSVVPSMAEGFVAADGPLAERLVAGLRAADQAGGDARGRQSAALVVVDAARTDAPWDGVPIDLRVDDAAEPVYALGRLLSLQRAYESGDWAALLERAPEGVRELYATLDAASRGDLDTARESLAALRRQPSIDSTLRRMRAAGQLPHAAELMSD